MTASGKTTMTITAPAKGTYTITVTGTDAETYLSHDITVNVTVK